LYYLSQIYANQTVYKYILTDLLREKMGFGLVVTVASHMVAMISAMKRSDSILSL
jgi:beta-N-acetylhexosaminidase